MDPPSPSPVKSFSNLPETLTQELLAARSEAKPPSHSIPSLSNYSLPEKFSGKEPEKFKSWFMLCKIYFNLNEISTEQTKIMLATTALAEPALLWATNMMYEPSLYQGTLATFESFANSLKEMYGTSLLPEISANRMLTLSQKSGELS